MKNREKEVCWDWRRGGVGPRTGHKSERFRECHQVLGIEEVYRNIFATHLSIAEYEINELLTWNWFSS